MVKHGRGLKVWNSYDCLGTTASVQYINLNTFISRPHINLEIPKSVLPFLQALFAKLFSNNLSADTAENLPIDTFFKISKWVLTQKVFPGFLKTVLHLRSTQHPGVVEIATTESRIYRLVDKVLGLDLTGRYH